MKNLHKLNPKAAFSAKVQRFAVIWASYYPGFHPLYVYKKKLYYSYTNQLPEEFDSLDAKSREITEETVDMWIRDFETAYLDVKFTPDMIKVIK